MTKIALVDDHTILRNGIKLICKDIKDLEVVIEASNGKEFIDQIDLKKPDIAIVDIRMPVMAGDEAVRIAKQKMPNLKIIILSMFCDEQYYSLFNELNVDGYLLKEADFSEFTKAIEIVINGGKFFSKQLLLNLQKDKALEQPTSGMFTEQELTILKMLCDGSSLNEIAEKTNQSATLVEELRNKLLQKTQKKNTISLVIYAIENKLVKF